MTLNMKNNCRCFHCHCWEECQEFPACSYSCHTFSHHKFDLQIAAAYFDAAAAAQFGAAVVAAYLGAVAAAVGHVVAAEYLDAAAAVVEYLNAAAVVEYFDAAAAYLGAVAACFDVVARFAAAGTAAAVVDAQVVEEHFERVGVALSHVAAQSPAALETVAAAGTANSFVVAQKPAVAQEFVAAQELGAQKLVAVTVSDASAALGDVEVIQSAWELMVGLMNEENHEAQTVGSCKIEKPILIAAYAEGIKYMAYHVEMSRDSLLVKGGAEDEVDLALAEYEQSVAAQAAEALHGACCAAIVEEELTAAQTVAAFAMWHHLGTLDFPHES